MSRGGVGAPLTRQRSEWVQDDRAIPMRMPGMEHRGTYHRQVHDGSLRAIHTLDLGLHHLSVSFVDRKGKPSRYPTWDELSHARYHFLPHGIDVVMHLPPQSEYVALHDSTFHLHETEPSGE